MGVSLQRRLRIGVDVGGTNTDAVVLDPTQHALPSRGVLASHKTPTTRDTAAGIEAAVGAVLAQSGVHVSQLSSVTVGTTAFLNAVVERDARLLSRVAILRLSRSFLRDVRPFSDWPDDLADAIRGYIGYVDGGLHIDGSEEAPVVEAQVVEQCRAIREQGLRTVVVAGVYSPIDRDFHQEDAVRHILEREIPGIDVVCSHEVANIGFLERENAAVLNAAILRFARRTIQSFRAAMTRLGLVECPLYLTQNDGTLLDAVSAARVPIRTFSSGVVNSMRGAAYLSGRLSNHGKGESAVVVDIGGTTTDVGVMLPSGMPRQASAYVDVAGIKVNYSLPQLHSIGLGGGSIVVRDDSGGKVSVGPASVGSELGRSLVFGGSTTTATDVAVAAGLVNVGSQDAVANLDRDLLRGTLARVKVMLEQAIDMVKTSPDPMPVFLTGGGSLLAPDSLQGVSRIIKPPFYDVANAVGAACSKVGATVDIIQSISQQSMAEATEEAKRMAMEKAIVAGALRETVYVAKVDVMPIPYLENQIRSVVTAIGDLDSDAKPPPVILENTEAKEPEVWPEVAKEVAWSTSEAIEVSHETYKPSVHMNDTTGMPEWHLSRTDLEYIADGSYLLGCGGGGNPEPGKLQLRDMLVAGHTIRVVDVASLPADAVVYWGGRMGSPAAISERLQAHETVLAMRTLMAHLRHDSFDAVMGLEIGGSNGMEPFLWGSSRFFDRPVIDGDFMGRANPMCWQTTLTVHRPGEFVPCAIDSGAGISMVMAAAPRDEAVDRPLRAALTEMGSLVGLAARPTTAGVVRECAVLRSVSQAWRVGRAMARAKARRCVSATAEAIIQELGGDSSAKLLFRGKIAAIERTLRKGLSVGVLHIVEASSGPDMDEELGPQAAPAVARGGSLRIPFMNENILVEHVTDDGSQRVLATAPDLIALIDRESGKAVGVPEYRYGCHVAVLGIACSPRWTETARGIEIGGPKGYGYDLEYKPLGEHVEPRSVIDEFFQ